MCHKIGPLLTCIKMSYSNHSSNRRIFRPKNLEKFNIKSLLEQYVPYTALVEKYGYP